MKNSQKILHDNKVLKISDSSSENELDDKYFQSIKYANNLKQDGSL